MEDVLPRLRDIDVERLSGGATTARAAHRAEAAEHLLHAAPPTEAAPRPNQAAGVPRKTTLEAADAARERFLARRAGKQQVQQQGRR